MPVHRRHGYRHRFLGDWFGGRFLGYGRGGGSILRRFWHTIIDHGNIIYIGIPLGFGIVLGLCYALSTWLFGGLLLRL